MHKNSQNVEHDLIAEISRLKKNPGPVALVVDNFLACDRLLPLSILLKQKGIEFRYWYCKQFSLGHLFHEFEEQSGISIEKQEIGGFADRMLSKLRLSAVIKLLLRGLNWRRKIGRILARGGTSLVIVVSNNKFSLGRVALAEVEKHKIPAINILWRAMTRSEYLAYLQRPNNLNSYLVRKRWLVALLKLVLKPDHYELQNDGSILLSSVLASVLAFRFLLPREKELFCPLSAYADINCVHPAVQSITGDKIRLMAFPEEKVLESDGRYSGILREIQTRKDREGLRVILMTCSDLYSEEEIRIHEECIRTLCSDDRVLVVASRQSGASFTVLKDRLSHLNLKNLVLTPYTGMMLLPYIDGCVAILRSDLGIYAEYYGIPLVRYEFDRALEDFKELLHRTFHCS